MKGGGPGPSDLAHTRRAAAEGFESLSVPTHRGSTIVYPSYQAFIERGRQGRKAYSYGLHGTPTTRTLENKLSELEGACDTFLAPSGLMAVTATLLALCDTGDVVLLPDNVYPPVRRFAATMLARLGIATVFYDPRNPEAAFPAGARIRVVWAEAPGSTTMESPDFARLRRLADAYGAVLGCDNSWATPLYCTPLALGCDIVVEAVTKYLAGHADLLLGSISLRDEALAGTVHGALRALGVGVSPDDCFLALRGLETAAVRLDRMQRSALALARRLGDFGSLEEVLHPALESFPDHALWRRQFRGASGLFSVVMKDEDAARLAARFDGLRLFRLGASWGGVQSLLAPTVLDAERTVNRRYADRPIVRLSIGLEAEEDLFDDLARCFG
jgi:cystathionine beta-lyase